jgi:hypothetical protein
VDFDDSGWRYAIAPYPTSPGTPPPLPGSFWIWDFDGTPSTWGIGPNQAFFRKSFTINAPVVSAIAEFIIDDELQFYVNGILVTEDLSGGAGYIGPIDIAPFLQQGENVLAIRAWDGDGCSVFDRENESLSVLVNIETEVAPTDVSGCINLKGSSLVNRKVILKQRDEPMQITKTDTNGCYEFESVVAGKRFIIFIIGPVVPE